MTWRSDFCHIYGASIGADSRTFRGGAFLYRILYSIAGVDCTRCNFLYETEKILSGEK